MDITQVEQQPSKPRKDDTCQITIWRWKSKTISSLISQHRYKIYILPSLNTEHIVNLSSLMSPLRHQEFLTTTIKSFPLGIKIHWKANKRPQSDFHSKWVSSKATVFTQQKILSLHRMCFLSCSRGMVTQSGNSVLKRDVTLEDTCLMCLTLTADASYCLWLYFQIHFCTGIEVWTWSPVIYWSRFKTGSLCSRVKMILPLRSEVHTQLRGCLNRKRPVN